MSESILTVFCAFCFSLLIVSLLLPWFNEVAEKNIQLLVENPWFWVFGIGFTLLTAILAGSYPAFYLSSFQPVSVLKGRVQLGRLRAIPRQILVVIQFSVSISLIIATIIVYQQIQYGKDRPNGYEEDGLISMEMRSKAFIQGYELFKNELVKAGVVSDITRSSYAVTSTMGWNPSFDWPGKEADFDPAFNTITVSPEYGKTVGWEFVAGRDFAEEITTDKKGVILNESAVRLMGLENPVGELITWNPSFFKQSRTYTILGVVKDMIKGSPYEKTEPSIMFLEFDRMTWVYMRLNPQLAPDEALASIQAIFEENIAATPFEYTFVVDTYAEKFREEERIATLSAFFAIWAIFISCMGLFGLASYVAEQRSKELGVRKILGASPLHLWGMLSKNFSITVLISAAFAIPISYYLLTNWLNTYEYSTEISWWVLIGAALAALVLALITVSTQVIRVVRIDPVDSLRTE